MTKEKLNELRDKIDWDEVREHMFDTEGTSIYVDIEDGDITVMGSGSEPHPDSDLMFLVDTLDAESQLENWGETDVSKDGDIIFFDYKTEKWLSKEEAEQAIKNNVDDLFDGNMEAELFSNIIERLEEE